MALAEEIILQRLFQIEFRFKESGILLKKERKKKKNFRFIFAAFHFRLFSSFSALKV
jgi:hypothetical protein